MCDCPEPLIKQKKALVIDQGFLLNQGDQKNERPLLAAIRIRKAFNLIKPAASS